MKVRTVSLGTGPENSRKFCTFVSMSVILRCSFMESFDGQARCLTVDVQVLYCRHARLNGAYKATSDAQRSDISTVVLWAGRGTRLQFYI